MPADAARPSLDIGSIIGRSFDTFGREWSLFVVLAVPAALGSLLQIVLTPGMTSYSAQLTLADLPPYVVSSLVAALVGVVSTALTVVAADELWQGRPAGLPDTITLGLRALPRYLAVVVLLGLAVAAAAAVIGVVVFAAWSALGSGGALLGILAAFVAFPVLLWVSARLTLLAPVAVLERRGVIASITQAWDLSRDRVILLFALTLAMGICSGLPVWGVSLFVSFAASPLIAGVALALATLVATPLPTIALVLAWGDLTGGRHRESELMARGRGRGTAAALVLGLGATLFVVGFGLAAQHASSIPTLR